MCRRVDCRECGKPTFAGCGMHVEQVLGGVPRDQRCRCGEAPAKQAGTSAGSAPTSGGKRSWLGGLFGK
jgi:hypothetical protein